MEDAPQAVPPALQREGDGSISGEGCSVPAKTSTVDSRAAKSLSAAFSPVRSQFNASTIDLTHRYRMPGSMIIDITYGFDVRSEDDPWLTAAENAVESINAIGSPGSFLGTSTSNYKVRC